MRGLAGHGPCGGRRWHAGCRRWRFWVTEAKRHGIGIAANGVPPRKLDSFRPKRDASGTVRRGLARPRKDLRIGTRFALMTAVPAEGFPKLPNLETYDVEHDRRAPRVLAPSAQRSLYRLQTRKETPMSEHPTLTRMRRFASSHGSRAQTTAGVLRYLRAHPCAVREGMQREVVESRLAAERRLADRRMRVRYYGRAGRRRRIADLLGLLSEIRNTLDIVQGRCSQRLLSIEDVLFAITRAPYDSGRMYVANSYGYPYTWTQVVATPKAAGVEWCVDRVGAAYQMDRAWEHCVHKSTVRGIAWGEALLDGDAIAIRRSGSLLHIYDRYDSDGRHTGVCRRLPEELESRWGRWEHGKTPSDLKREIEHKRRVLQYEAEAAATAEKLGRKARLLSRLSSRIRASFADARSVGYCVSGIEAWCARRGVAVDSTVPISLLARDSDCRARHLAERLALRALENIVDN